MRRFICSRFASIKSHTQIVHTKSLATRNRCLTICQTSSLKPFNCNAIRNFCTNYSYLQMPTDCGRERKRERESKIARVHGDNECTRTGYLGRYNVLQHNVEETIDHSIGPNGIVYVIYAYNVNTSRRRTTAAFRTIFNWTVSE